MRPGYKNAIFALAIIITAMISFCSMVKDRKPKTPYEQAQQATNDAELKAAEARLKADRAKSKALSEASANETSIEAEKAAADADLAEAAADAAAEMAKEDQLKANVLRRPTK